jgi:hypothetical protein
MDVVSEAKLSGTEDSNRISTQIPLQSDNAVSILMNNKKSKYYDRCFLFTTDISMIQTIIESSNYANEIDPIVILDINKHVAITLDKYNTYVQSKSSSTEYVSPPNYGNISTCKESKNKTYSEKKDPQYER